MLHRHNNTNHHKPFLKGEGTNYSEDTVSRFAVRKLDQESTLKDPEEEGSSSQNHLIPCSLVKIANGVYFPLILPHLLSEDEGLMVWLKHYQTEIKPPKQMSPHELMETMETLEQYMRSHDEWKSNYPHHHSSTNLSDDAFQQLDKYAMRMMNILTSRILRRSDEDQSNCEEKKVLGNVSQNSIINTHKDHVQNSEENSKHQNNSSTALNCTASSLPSECLDRRNEKKQVIELYKMVYSLFDETNIPFLISNSERREIENRKELSIVSQFLKEFVENHIELSPNELLPSMIEFKHSCNKERLHDSSNTNILENLRLQWIHGLLSDLDFEMTRNFKTPTRSDRMGLLCTECAISGEFSSSHILQSGNWIIVRNVCNLPLKLMELGSNCGAGILADPSNMFLYKVVKRKKVSEYSPKFEWTYCTHFDLDSLEQRCLAFATLWKLLLDLQKENDDRKANATAKKNFKEFVSRVEKLLTRHKTQSLAGGQLNQTLRKVKAEKSQNVHSVETKKVDKEKQPREWRLDEHLKVEHKKIVDELNSPINKMMHKKDVKERTEKILKSVDLSHFTH
ncbi:hypothetical protein FDP41_002769 [Naegleria fowleri]|uniref:Uncharacterized protein n=1 Tax=Naegleria fowleri TaxID=5763 RepID=A0A6A5BVG6_NAEFO|nr:uncharacterized protein FDP41_002769 [Naegleria fowleri]KAF0978254.1 hypothetical protein FDP41_002769 [Naegleria fowleri]CAG4712596.1 unnamed protein product [Naegleria fowleri]